MTVVLIASCGSDSGTKPERAATAPLTTAPSSEPRRSPASEPADSSDLIAGAKYIDVVETDGGPCVLYADGRVACWTSRQAMALIPDIGDAIALEATERHVAITLRRGKIWEHPVVYYATKSWYGPPDKIAERASRCVRLVDGSVQCDCLGWVRAPLELAAIDIAEGGNTNCAVTRAGDVECWGQTSSILGDRTTPGATTDYQHVCPTQRGTFQLGDAVGVTVGAWHGCVLRNTGAVACWGDADYIGTTPGKTPGTPVTVAIPPARVVRSLHNATCAVTRDLSSYCWGFFRHPAIDDGILSDHPKPVRLPLDGVVAVSPGVSYAIVDGGQRVVTWAMRSGCRDAECHETYDIAMPP